MVGGMGGHEKAEPERDETDRTEHLDPKGGQQQAGQGNQDEDEAHGMGVHGDPQRTEPLRKLSAAVRILHVERTCERQLLIDNFRRGLVPPLPGPGQGWK